MNQETANITVPQFAKLSKMQRAIVTYLAVNRGYRRAGTVARKIAPQLKGMKVFDREAKRRELLHKFLVDDDLRAGELCNLMQNFACIQRKKSYLVASYRATFSRAVKRLTTRGIVETATKVEHELIDLNNPSSWLLLHPNFEICRQMHDAKILCAAGTNGGRANYIKLNTSVKTPLASPVNLQISGGNVQNTDEKRGNLPTIKNGVEK